MRHRFRFVLLLLACITAGAVAQDAIPSPQFVPPDRLTNGETAYYRDMAVIETSCSDWAEVRALWTSLTEKGALISVIASPQRWLGWVPPAARPIVGAATVPTATGHVGVRNISYSSLEHRKNNPGPILSAASDEDAAEAVVEYLDFIKRTKTKEELQRIEDRALELEHLAGTIEQPNCVDAKPVPQGVIVKRGDATQGGPAPEIARRSRPVGLIVHSSFFLESQSGSGSWNWDNTVYNRYRSFYLDGLTYWTGIAAKYGQTASHIWLNYSPSSWVTQINGEPVVVQENGFVPTVVNRLYPPSAWDILDGSLPLSWVGNSGLEQRHAWGWYFNNKRRAAYSADQSIFGCIAWKGTPDEGIWPHAVNINWGNGDIEGIYFAMDVRYWQAGLDPYAAPDRNVVAHEIGHLWGSPDEYRDDNCSWSYRGAANINCQTERSASSLGRPGLNVFGFDAMMVGNFLLGTSSVQPVHTGLLNAANATPLRCITTQPANGQFTIKACDLSSYGKATRSFSKPMCFPLEYDHCNKLSVPLTRNISGTTWYFDYWEVKRQSGATTNIDWYANELPSSAYTSTKANPVTDIKAVYTNSPPDIFTANATVQAWLAPASTSAAGSLALAVRWRSKYNMNDAQTKVEWERSPGSWVEVTPTLGPFTVNVNQWTGVHITQLPGVSGNIAVAANTQYRFRIVGIFNTVRGTVSNVAEIRTRPSSPADTAYCNDAYEPNSLASPRMLTSSGPGMTPYTIEAACPMSPYPSEFTWFVPKNDYYRLTAINLSGMSFGEKVMLTLKVSPGSDFRPKFRAKRAGEVSYINATYAGGDRYRIALINDGEYILSVEPEISGYFSNRLVEPSDGHFGFGEYSLSVERVENVPPLVSVCPECIKLHVTRPFPGILISKIPGDAFDKGLDRRTPLLQDIHFIPPPGFIFDGWDLPKPEILEDPSKNPTKIVIGPNTPTGEYEIGAKLRPIPQDRAELSIIYPQGPEGPLEDRTTHPIGTVVNVQANSSIKYQFIGWSHDTVSTTNPLPVTMWRNKRLIALWREKPCQPEQMVPWQHRISFTNARQGNVLLDYGMNATAGDGLEAGQIDLPPFPPAGTFDIRWINIAGSQGSTTDLRALAQSFTYLGRVQTGAGTAPVSMTWGLPPAPPNATFMLYVQGEATPFDMRSTTSYTFAAEGTYQIRIEVKIPSCPPRTKDPEVVVVPQRNDPKGFPCAELGFQFRDRKTNVLYPLYNPFQFLFYEKGTGDEVKPVRFSEISQLPDLTLFRLCMDPAPTDPEREIIIVNDEQDEESKDETIRVKIPIPTPPGTGNPTRFVQQHSREWELVSLPLDVKTPDTDVLFSDPMTRLYGFNTATPGYEAAAAMTFGDGYWLKTMDPSTTYYGFEKLLFEWNTLSGIGETGANGWNLIGSLSKPMSVASITQTPAGSMRAIFGYNPATGYVVPSNIEPGKGYWVRMDRGGKLKMQTSLTGPGGPSAYSKAVASLNVTGRLSASTDDGRRRDLVVTSSVMNAQTLNDLQLPMLPPDGNFDARTEYGTLFLSPGMTGIDLRANGTVTLAFEPLVPVAAGYELVDDKGAVLATFNGTTPATATIRVDGVTRVFLKIAIAAEGAFALEQNFPNPFAPTSDGATTLTVSLSRPSNTRVAVYDMMGREVRVLLDQDLPAGVKHVRWDGKDASGSFVAPGSYLVRLQSVEGTLTRTMLLTNAR